MTTHDIATRLAVLRVLLAELKTVKYAADTEVRDTWRTGDRLAAVLPTGEQVASVTLARGRQTARLADEDAYTAWVERTHPEWMETVTITRVRADHTDRLLAVARKLGEPIDAETGEVAPGITVETGEPYPTVRLTAGAREAVAAAWRDGTLAELLGGLLAIEGGEAS